MDTIGRQVTAFVTLFMAIALILLMYLIFEPQRRRAAADEHNEVSAERGAVLFAENCVVCHGPTGQGIAGAGFPLNTDENRCPDEERREFLRRTLHRGRPNSNGMLPNMPVFLNTEGGALNTQQIEDLINFIGYGDWEEVPHILAGELGTPVAALPTPPNLGTPDPNQAGRGGAPGGQARPSPAASSADPGAAVFQANCIQCHRIAPEFTAGGGVGPNLTGIAIRPFPSRKPAPTVLQPSAENLTRWIRNPGEVKPGTAMPGFGEDKISDQQMQQLVDWLMKHNTPPAAAQSGCR